MLHFAAGVAPDDVRHLQRTTIAGDYALGRVESAQGRDPRTRCGSTSNDASDEPTPSRRLDGALHEVVDLAVIGEGAGLLDRHTG
jgi:hypothetical protein